ITAVGSFVEPKILAGKNGLLVGNYIQDSFLQFGYLPIGAAAAVVVLVPTIVLLYVYIFYAQGAAEQLGRESRLAAFARAVWTRLARFARPARAPLPDPKLTDGMDARTSGGTGVSSTLVSMGRIVERTWDAVAAKYGSKMLGAFTLLVLAAYYVPLGQVVVFSFNHDNNIINWSSFSTRWYFPERSAFEVRALFADTDMMNALRDSIIIGLSVTVISLLIGIPAALSIVRYRFGTKPFLNLMLYAGLVMPSIILGVSLLVFVRFFH